MNLIIIKAVHHNDSVIIIGLKLLIILCVMLIRIS